MLEDITKPYQGIKIEASEYDGSIDNLCDDVATSTLRCAIDNTLQNKITREQVLVYKKAVDTYLGTKKIDFQATDQATDQATEPVPLQGEIPNMYHGSFYDKMLNGQEVMDIQKALRTHECHTIDILGNQIPSESAREIRNSLLQYINAEIELPRGVVKVEEIKAHVQKIRNQRYVFVQNYIQSGLRKTTSIMFPLIVGGGNKVRRLTKTSTFIYTGKHKRIVYVGKRGGQYIKRLGKFVSIKKL